MTGAFFGLDLALRALTAQQAAVNVVNHNIANANTEGFSRQSVELETTTPYTLPGMNRAPGAGQIGTGVVLGAIQRARDSFLDLQYRAEAGGQRNAQVAQETLEQVEVTLNEPSETGLSSLFSSFFGAWQQLTTDPSDRAARSTVIGQGSALAAELNRDSQQLQELRQRLNDRVQSSVQEVNSITGQISALNKQIVQVEVTGQRANDLRDRRDRLLDELAGYVQFSTSDNPDGSVNILLGAHTLVSGATAETLTTTGTGPGGMWEVRFSSDNSLATLGKAEISALIEMRDIKLSGYLGQLDQIAADLISAVNGLHTAGFGADGLNGRAFFTGATAGTIAVDPAIAADPQKVAAASAANQAGNNVIALAIAQLRTTMSPTSEGAVSALVAGLGVDARAAGGLTDNQTALVALLGQRRQAVSGVSLDEETVDLLRYQRAYEAAARLITTSDEMLDRLINSTGVVGR